MPSRQWVARLNLILQYAAKWSASQQPAMSETHLLTLTETAEQTGLTVDALRKRVTRGQLSATRGHDVRVRLSEGQLAKLKVNRPSNCLVGQTEQLMSLLNCIESHIIALREQLARAEERADRAIAELRTEREANRQREAVDTEERRRLVDRITELSAELARLAGSIAGVHQPGPQLEFRPEPCHVDVAAISAAFPAEVGAEESADVLFGRRRWRLRLRRRR